MKQCRKCNETKEFKEFSVRKEGKDGYYNACIPCRNLYAHKPEYIAKNKEWTAANKRQVLQTKKRYRDKNKHKPEYIEKQKVRRLSSRLKNPEKFRERCREWKRENRGACIEFANKRRITKLNAQISLSEEKQKEMTEIFKRAGNLTKMYGKRFFSVDHIIPLSNPKVCGLNVPWNLQIITGYENCIKHNKFDGTYNNDSWRYKMLFTPILKPVPSRPFNLKNVPFI